MLYLINYLFSFVIFIFASGQEFKNDAIRFDGFYETKCIIDEDDDEGDQSYLRFYPDGKVISVGTDCDGTAEDLKDWFNLESKSVSIGEYKIKGNKVEFSTKSNVGEVLYKGRVLDNSRLSLKIKSLINGYKRSEEYHFVQIPELKY